MDQCEFDVHQLPGAIAEAQHRLFSAKRELKAARERVAEIRRVIARRVAQETTHADVKIRSLDTETRIQNDVEYLAARVAEDEHERAREAAAIRVQFLRESFAVRLAGQSAGKAQATS
jgi:ribosomal protein L18E